MKNIFSGTVLVIFVTTSLFNVSVFALSSDKLTKKDEGYIQIFNNQKYTVEQYYSQLFQKKQILNDLPVSSKSKLQSLVNHIFLFTNDPNKCAQVISREDRNKKMGKCQKIWDTPLATIITKDIEKIQIGQSIVLINYLDLLSKDVNTENNIFSLYIETEYVADVLAEGTLQKLTDVVNPKISGATKKAMQGYLGNSLDKNDAKIFTKIIDKTSSKFEALLKNKVNSTSDDIKKVFWENFQNKYSQRIKNDLSLSVRTFSDHLFYQDFTYPKSNDDLAKARMIFNQDFQEKFKAVNDVVLLKKAKDNNAKSINDTLKGLGMIGKTYKPLGVAVKLNTSAFEMYSKVLDTAYPLVIFSEMKKRFVVFGSAYTDSAEIFFTK